MSTKKPIRLGHKATDLVTGMVGFVTAYTDALGSARRWTLQLTEVKDGNYPNAFDIDDAQLEYVETKKPLTPTDPDPAMMAIELGSSVMDRVSEYRGKTVARIVFLNGCVYYRLEGPVMKDKPTEINSQTFPAVRLEVLSTPPAPVKRPGTGGPVTPSIRMVR